MSPSASDPDPARVAVDMIGAFQRAGMSCAIGGALALGFWGVIRGTHDADLNVFIREDRYEELVGVLEGAGCAPALDRSAWTSEDRAEFLRRAREGEVAIAWKDGLRVDVFVPSIPFYDEAERTVRQIAISELGRSLPVLSPEALTIFKMLFFRPKDLLDIRTLVARQGPALDRSYIRDQLVAMVGPQDERIPVWDEIVKTHGS